jgi:hypothetical protein
MQVQIKFFGYLSAVRAAYIFDIPAGIQDGGKKLNFLQKMINLSDKGTVLFRFTTDKGMFDSKKNYTVDLLSYSCYSFTSDRNLGVNH